VRELVDTVLQFRRGTARGDIGTPWGSACDRRGMAVSYVSARRRGRKLDGRPNCRRTRNEEGAKRFADVARLDKGQREDCCIRVLL